MLEVRANPEELGALFAAVGEEDEPDPQHPGMALLGETATGIIDQITGLNVMGHVIACPVCQQNSAELVLMATLVATDRARFAQDLGIHLDLVSVFRSANRTSN